MNKETNKETVIDHIDYSDYSEELKKGKKTKTTEYLWGIIIGVLSLILFAFLLSRGFSFIVFGIVLILCFLLFILILLPLIWSLSIITLRTKSSFHMFELFIYFQSLIVSVIFLVTTFSFYGASSFTGPNPFFIVASLGWIFIFFQREMIKRKPLLISERRFFHTAPIVSIHSMEIEEGLDGYSQRPISSEFQVLQNLVVSLSDFTEKLEEYCTFIGKKGELIGWDIYDTFALIYPRFLIRGPNLSHNPLFYYDLLRRIRKKEDITSIEISFSPPRISINIIFEDYDILNKETTFHTLCFNVLESLKISLIAFLNNDLDTAYKVLIKGR